MSSQKDLERNQDEGYCTLASQSAYDTQSQSHFDQSQVSTSKDGPFSQLSTSADRSFSQVSPSVDGPFSQASTSTQGPFSQVSTSTGSQAFSGVNQSSTEQSQPSTSSASQAIVDSILNPAPCSSHGIELKIYNVHSRVELGYKLDLKHLCTRIRTAEWDPNWNFGLCMKLLDPIATIKVSVNGKLICLGTKSLEDSNLASRKAARIIQKCGYPKVKFNGFRICNIVATCDLNFPIKFEDFLQTYGQFATHSPEIFPGVFFRMIRPRVLVIIFVNGSLLLTSASSMDVLYEALDKIYEILLKFKKKSKNTDSPTI